MRAPIPLLSALAGLALLAGCSHEHGPLSDTPDTTSLGVAGGLGMGGVSTAYGIYPESPGLKGVDNNTAQRDTSTATRPTPLIPGMPNNAESPRTSNAMEAWSSGPNLPVEPANMALEPEAAGHPG